MISYYNCDDTIYFSKYASKLNMSGYEDVCVGLTAYGFRTEFYDAHYLSIKGIHLDIIFFQIILFHNYTAPEAGVAFA